MTVAAARAQRTADALDQEWLDERVSEIEDGVQSVVVIARNWTEGRNLSRLHPGVSAVEYVTNRVGTLGKTIVPVLLAESNWSNRQIAAVAGVDEGTVRNQLRNIPQLDRPAETLGADGKVRAYPRVVREVTAEIIEEPPEPDTGGITDVAAMREELAAAMRAVTSLEHQQHEIAAAIFPRRRAATAKRLRALGLVLGGIAFSLEQMKEQP